MKCFTNLKLEALFSMDKFEQMNTAVHGSKNCEQ